MSRRWIGNDDRRNRKGILEVLPVLSSGIPEDFLDNPIGEE